MRDSKPWIILDPLSSAPDVAPKAFASEVTLILVKRSTSYIIFHPLFDSPSSPTPAPGKIPTP
ncbi:hypothetical protein B0H17DRAFT_1062175 [Mycena rosella]|uniref:Uncharacterized protein n=1 Tax=Mycena rosella TaxID=1033263 RepID=A0AAD7GI32_MYCRO|nr:hypothetical protein B0H17DRAFT_1062175 [Mycena rosella]